MVFVVEFLKKEWYNKDVYRLFFLCGLKTPVRADNTKERRKTMDGCDSCGRSKNNGYQMKSDAEPLPRRGGKMRSIFY